jgi:uncharacterized SAM-binding protein YcdF (DUF218 family)
LLLALPLLGALWATVVGALILLDGRRDDAPRSDAIVVLGAAQYNGVPSPVFRARLDHALELYEAGKAPLIIVAGGKMRGDRYTEGAAGARYLRREGVPEGALLAVGVGRDTRASLRAVAEAARPRGVRSTLIVSDPFHIYRSRQIASDLGFEAHGSPTRSSPIGDDAGLQLRYTIREVLAYTAYALGLD